MPAATVAVFDALGRAVATLHAGALASGTTELRWDAAGAAPGGYVVRTEANGRTHALRLVKR